MEVKIWLKIWYGLCNLFIGIHHTIQGKLRCLFSTKHFLHQINLKFKLLLTLTLLFINILPCPILLRNHLYFVFFKSKKVPCVLYSKSIHLKRSCFLYIKLFMSKLGFSSIIGYYLGIKWISIYLRDLTQIELPVSRKVSKLKHHLYFSSYVHI